MKRSKKYLLILPAAALLLLYSCDVYVNYDDYYYDEMTEEIQAFRANDFLNTIGVNSSINSRGENINSTIECMNYLGARWIRSGPGLNINLFQRIHDEAGGVMFSCGLMSGSETVEADIPGTISFARQLANKNLLLALEGSNEPNNWKVLYKGRVGGGNNDGDDWAPLARLHRDFYNAVKADPVLQDYPVWHLSDSGAEINNVGLHYLKIPPGGSVNPEFPDGTQYSDFANCHNYILHPSWPGLHNNQTWIASDPSRNSSHNGLYTNFGRTWRKGYIGYSDEELMTLPKVTTETGTTIGDDVSEEMQGLLYMSCYLCQFKRGWSYTSMYILRDRSDEGGNQTFGFFQTDYTPRKSAHYLHNMTTILDDYEWDSEPQNLYFNIPSKPNTVHHLLLQKYDGTHFLVVWGERFEGGTDRISVDFTQSFRQINIYNPVEGTEPVDTLQDVSSVVLNMTNHPYILELGK